MPDTSPKEISPTNGQPIDKAYRSRAARVLVPLWALLTLGNLILAIANNHDTTVPAVLFFAVAILGLIRLRWPRDTWPAWLFSYKP